MEKWFEGVYLLGQFNTLRTGCWLLAHGSEAAVLEMPPHDRDETSPVEAVAAAVRHLNVTVKLLLCTHAHDDHFCKHVFKGLRQRYPDAAAHLQSGFREELPGDNSVRWFDGERELALNGEPLYLVHAPKHSVSDTMVIFRGAICTGDWELRTIRSVHDHWSGISRDRKLASISRLIDFVRRHHYRIHQVFSAHANDRREGADFIELMEDTRVDRKFW